MAFTFGIAKILSGDKAADGGLGTALTEHDETLKGTAQLTRSDEDINWIETEERGKRLAISQSNAETILEFEVANPSLETQAYYCGGAVKTANGKKSYSPPTNSQSIEKSFKIETKSGYDIVIPNGKVTATPLSGTIGTENVMTMKVRVAVQQPDKAGVDALTYQEK
ncbi:hypothetical protein SAMN05443429_10888 [Cruoricaptor ignavus]|uniref:Phage tail tube protein n=1 Tax=Cruoricaptor ignavus TaxID=1118202 RepID=A0A1M6G7K9_9FLAO|nr:hypothetical protein [Cruoricaptor ignavus]SHJ05918.1 hypothetical protein SAMN05443429_10888 [Cruoricaptor ignavus]